MIVGPQFKGLVVGHVASRRCVRQCAARGSYVIYRLLGTSKYENMTRGRIENPLLLLIYARM